MKKILSLVLLCLSASSFALSNYPNCSKANWPVQPGQDGAFCEQFSNAAYCHCSVQLKKPEETCRNEGVEWIWKQLIQRVGLDKACQLQRDVTKEDCISQWNYYNSHCK